MSNRLPLSQSAERALARSLREVRGCALCATDLPLGPNPVLRGRVGARVLIISQAPGTRVHASGIPWDDASGARLRDWTGLGKDSFYDPVKVALIPMGFCYPGTGASGDLPPRPPHAARGRIQNFY